MTDTASESTSAGSGEGETVSLYEATDSEVSSALQERIAAERSAQTQAKAREPYADTEAANAAPDKPEEQAAEQGETEVPDLAQQLARTQEQLQRAQEFIQRRNAEIGEQRKQLREYEARLEQYVQEQFYENPNEALDARDELVRTKDTLEQLDREEVALNRKAVTRQMLERHKPQDVSYQDMAMALKRQGLPDEQINNFLADPEGYVGPTEAVAIAHQARAEKYLGAVLKEAQRLKAENEQLKKRGNPSSVLQNVERAMRSGPTLTASGGDAVTAEEMYSAPAELSDDQLRSALASRLKRERGNG